MASAADQLRLRHQPVEVSPGDRSQEAPVVHARRADRLPLAVSFVPLPGVDPTRCNRCSRADPGRRARLLQHLLGRRSRAHEPIIALGVMPYITASIVVQLGDVAVAERSPRSRRKARAGRKKLNQYTLLRHRRADRDPGLFHRRRAQDARRDARVPPGGGRAGHAVPRHRRDLRWSAAPIFLMWLGEQITSRGIGNGVSLIIMAGIVAQPAAYARTAVRERPHRLARSGCADHRHRRSW